MTHNYYIINIQIYYVDNKYLGITCLFIYSMHIYKYNAYFTQWPKIMFRDHIFLV